MKIHDVEQRSDAWYAIRVGKPTASEFSNIITSEGKPSKSVPEYAITLAAELYAGKRVDPWDGNRWTERGREFEEQAVRLYDFAHDTETQPVGFVTDDAGRIGCSPDGLVGDDGMVEVKCLMAKNHVKAILRYRKDGVPPPSYIQQTQGQLLICERAWCDLVFFHPELPLLVIRQEPIHELHEALRRDIPKLCAERDRVLIALMEQANPTQQTVLDAA